MSKTPFYVNVRCYKVLGGKRPLWHAKKEGHEAIGAGNTAENAIKDLQKTIRKNKK